MSGFVLFQHGKRKPPKTPRRRKVWSWALLTFAAFIAPFSILGAIQSAWRLEILAALQFAVLSAMLLAAVVIALRSLIVLARLTRISRANDG